MISDGVVVIAGWLEVITLSQIPSSWPFRIDRMSIISCPADLNQDLVAERTLLLVTRSVCALRSYPEPLVCSIYDHEPTLGLRLVPSAPCALLLGSSPRPSNNPWIGIHPSTQLSDWSLSTVCWPFILVMSASVAVSHTLRAHFCSRTTLDVFVCLHNSQIKVYLLCFGVV